MTHLTRNHPLANTKILIAKLFMAACLRDFGEIEESNITNLCTESFVICLKMNPLPSPIA